MVLSFAVYIEWESYEPWLWFTFYSSEYIMCMLVRLNDLYFLLVNLLWDFDRMFLFVIKLFVSWSYTNEKNKNVMVECTYRYLTILNYNIMIDLLIYNCKLKYIYIYIYIYNSENRPILAISNKFGIMMICTLVALNISIVQQQKLYALLCKCICMYS